MPIRSTELTSKREGNCNGLVTGPGLFIRKTSIVVATAMSSFALSSPLSSSSYLLGYNHQH